MRPSTLAIHRLKAEGRTGCGDPVRDWNGQSMVVVPLDTPEALQEAEAATRVGRCGRNGCR